MTAPDPIVEAVRAELLARSARGLQKYGVGLDRTDLGPRAFAQHLLEELLDAACYVRRLLQDLEQLDAAAGVPVKHPTAPD